MRAGARRCSPRWRTRPNLAEPDIERVRKLRLERLRQLRDMPRRVADRAFMRLLYREHPYGHSARHRGVAGGDDGRGRARVPCGGVRARRRDARDRRRCSRRRRSSGSRPRRSAAGRRRRRPAPSTATPACAAAAGRRTAAWPSCRGRRAAVGAAHRPRLRLARHARLPRAACCEHGARRPVRQPHQPEPARGQGLHLRRAHGVRLPPRRSGRSRCRPACRPRSPPTRFAKSLREIADIRGARPVTADELALGAAAVTRGYPRGFETGAAGGARRRAARAARSARHVLRGVRAAASTAVTAATTSPASPTRVPRSRAHGHARRRRPRSHRRVDLERRSVSASRSS